MGVCWELMARTVTLQGHIHCTIGTGLGYETEAQSFILSLLRCLRAMESNLLVFTEFCFFFCFFLANECEKPIVFCGAGVGKSCNQCFGVILAERIFNELTIQNHLHKRLAVPVFCHSEQTAVNMDNTIELSICFHCHWYNWTGWSVWCVICVRVIFCFFEFWSAGCGFVYFCFWFPSHLLPCDNIKKEVASGIGRIGVGGSGSSDIRRGRADTVALLLSSPFSIISLVSSSWSVWVGLNGQADWLKYRKRKIVRIEHSKIY